MSSTTEHTHAHQQSPNHFTCEVCRARLLGFEAIVSGLEKERRDLMVQYLSKRFEAVGIETRLGEVEDQLAAAKKFLACEQEHARTHHEHDRRAA